MTIPNVTLLPIDNPHAFAADIVIPINQVPVTDKLIELDFLANITTLLNDFILVVNIYFVFIFFLRFMDLIFEVSNHFLLILIELLKLFTSLVLFSSLCSKSWSDVFKGINGYIFLFF